MRKIVYLISVLLLCSSAMVIRGFKPARGSLITIEVKKVHPDMNTTTEPWLVTTALSPDPQRHMGLSSTTLAEIPNALNTADSTVMLSKNSQTYVLVYKTPDTSQDPIISIIEPETLPKSVGQNSVNSSFASIIDMVLALRDDGTVLLMSKSALAHERQKTTKAYKKKK